MKKKYVYMYIFGQKIKFAHEIGYDPTIQWAEVTNGGYKDKR